MGEELNKKFVSPEINLGPIDKAIISTDEKTTVVQLKNGRQAKVTRDAADVFDPFVGFCVAYTLASLGNKKSVLKRFIRDKFAYSKKKNHKNCILTNSSNAINIGGSFCGIIKQPVRFEVESIEITPDGTTAKIRSK